MEFIFRKISRPHPDHMFNNHNAIHNHTIAERTVKIKIETNLLLARDELYDWRSARTMGISDHLALALEAE